MKFLPIFLLVFTNPLQSQSWYQNQKIVAPVRSPEDWFGRAVAIDGKYAGVTAPREDEDENEENTIPYAGSAYIFEENDDGLWNMVQKIVPSDREMFSQFGSSIDISGNYLVAGVPLATLTLPFGAELENGGAAYIFERADNGTWAEVQKITASDADVGDWFGLKVSISGDYLIASASRKDLTTPNGDYFPYAGAVYVYKRQANGTWEEVQKLVADDFDTNYRFGFSCAIHGDKIIVGSPSDERDLNGGNLMDKSGSVYLFERNNDDNWVQVKKIVASDRAEDDQFGYRVSITEKYAVVGSKDETNDQFNTIKGAAYILERFPNAGWAETQKLTIDDGHTDHLFGNSVSIDSRRVVIGALSESEDEEGENYKEQAGAAYIFRKEINSDWVQVQKLVPNDRQTWDQFGNRVAISGNQIIAGASYQDYNEVGGGFASEAGAAYIFARPDFTDTAEKKLAKTTSIYPNPFDHDLYIDFSETLTNFELEILSLNGQTFFKQTFDRENSIRLHFDFPHGLYLLKITSAEEANTWKIVRD